MAKSNLAKKLTKELTRNPKKTAVLGLLALVAIWFWAPLAWKWIAPAGDDAGAVAAVEGATTPTAPAAATTTPGTPPAFELSWKNLSEMVAKEKLMASAPSQAAMKDPFARPVIQKQVAKTAEEGTPSEETVAPAQLPTPEQLGLTLTSTITGGSIRLATINGKLCQLGAVLVVPVGNIEHEFTIVDIAPHSVTMKGTHEAYTLEHKPRPSNLQLSRADARPAALVGGDRPERIIIRAFGGE
jgi:hypothetical protein